ncbi:MAG TPA: GNAT family N-acetyltransferase [Mycobacteriales bacterium]|nr:GNAT family N-acetyltransferase [Mycobacteriales bacterium]
MRLLRIEAAEAGAFARGETGSWPTAPGWPHDDTASGLSFARSGGLQYLVIDDDGRIAGECGTKAPPRGGVVEIGYGLAAPSRGRGLGTRAVGELVEVLRACPEVSAIDAEVHVSNAASRRVLERLGFVTDGQPTAGYLRYRLVTA